MPVDLPNFGTVLANGATVIESRAHKDGGIVILAQWTSPSGRWEYVVWRASGKNAADGHNDTYGGYYPGQHLALAATQYASR